MAEKTKSSETTEGKNTFEREYTIPLREKCRVVPRYKKTNKAIKTIKEFLARHMKIRDRDLKKIKIDRYLNETLWSRGIKNPPSKIKVKVTKETDKDGNEIVSARSAEMPEKLKFKKSREEKTEVKGMEAAEKKKAAVKKETSEETKAKEEKSDEEKVEEKAKAKAGEEATAQLEKAAAKQAKHQAKDKSKQPKHQIRKALAK